MEFFKSDRGVNGSSSGELNFMMCDKFLEMQGPFQMEDKKARLWLNSLDMEFQVYHLLKSVDIDLKKREIHIDMCIWYDLHICIYIYMYVCGCR